LKAEEIFWSILELDNPTIVAPNTALMNCVLRAWSKSLQGGAPERAESFLERATRLPHVSADAISHLHLIHVWARSGRRIASRKTKFHLEKVRAFATNDGNNDELLEAALAAAAKIRRF
jgi:hypothetical protein